jgi:hypothetical protein
MAASGWFWRRYQRPISISLPASWSLTMSSFSRASAAYSLVGKRETTSRSAVWAWAVAAWSRPTSVICSNQQIARM